MHRLLSIAALVFVVQLQPSAGFAAPWNLLAIAQDTDVARGDLFHRTAQHSAETRQLEIVQITPASVVIVVEGATVFIDPVGNQSQYARFGRPDIVVLTRDHPDHLSIATMIGMLRRDTVVLAPQEVIDQLPLMISNNTFAPFSPGTSQEVDGIGFTAMEPSQTIPASAFVQTRARGDIAVTMQVDDTLVYF